MPIYEYQFKKDTEPEHKGCEYCKEPFEVLLLKKEEEPTHCEKCQSPLERIISKNNFKLMHGGVGWADKSYSGSKK